MQQLRVKSTMNKIHRRIADMIGVKGSMSVYECKRRNRFLGITKTPVFKPDIKKTRKNHSAVVRFESSPRRANLKLHK